MVTVKVVYKSGFTNFHESKNKIEAELYLARLAFLNPNVDYEQSEIPEEP